MNKKTLICIISLVIVAVVVISIVLISTLTKENEKDNDKKENAKQTEEYATSNDSQEENEQSSENLTNIEYFKNMKEIKDVEVDSINCVLPTVEDQLYKIDVPITSEAIDKFGPFTLNDKQYENWEEVLNSEEIIEPESSIKIYEEQGKDYTHYNAIRIWNEKNQSRTIRECFEDGSIAMDLAKFTFGTSDEMYLGESEEFVNSHENLDILFKKLGTPTSYEYFDDLYNEGGFLNFEYEKFSIKVQISPIKNIEGLETFDLLSVTYYGNNTLKLEEEKDEHSITTRTEDKNDFINKYLEKVEYR